ncbi:YuzD family protein [Virgibacillus senegalensis]|uniref:YuzD family protein n=1 Tax=Virgibacillus senegalensis TaxID=1499679 RepID=UPI00069D38F3|nr:YuzD family protein [Virgibacillus senegalensis]
MNNQKVKLTVYGADQICASCVNAPRSVETYEWLQAAIARKYQEATIEYEYIDIFKPPNEKKHIDFARRVQDEEFFYPVVLINDELVDEGNPRLKKVFQALEENGIS